MRAEQADLVQAEVNPFRSNSREEFDEPAPDAEDLAADLVTVVIPALDEERTISHVLDSVCAQTYSNLQIIVVDGISDDRTVEVVRAHQQRDERIELVLNPDRLIPFALNLGVDRARGRWVVRVDAHSEIPDDYVERLVGHLRTGKWGGVGGRKDGVGHTPAGRAIAAVMGSKFAQGNSVYHYGTETQTVDHVPFGAYPTEVIRDLGGWSEVQLVNEDFEFDYRLRQSGRELLFDPEIRIRWDCRQSVGDLYRQYYRYGAGKVQTLRTHPESIAARNVAAPVVVAGLGVAAALLPWRRTRALSLALSAPYLAVIAAGTATTAPKLDTVEEKKWVVPAFLALHLGWGSGFWSEVLRGMFNKKSSRSLHAGSSGHTRG